jgi:hypothetical protein
MSQWWESLETDGDDEIPDGIGEDEEDPSTWDLTSGRAAAESVVSQPIENLDHRELLNLIIDGVQPDGSAAPDNARAYGLDIVLRDRDRGLWEAVLAGIAGEYTDGSPVDDWSVREAAQKKIEAARLDRTESWKDPRTGEIRFATGDPRSADERLVVRTPPSTRKVSSSERARKMLEAECAKRSLNFAETVASFRPGPSSEEERIRRAQLAIVVANVRAAGVTLEAIGEAIGVQKQRVHELAKVGSALLAHLAA